MVLTEKLAAGSECYLQSALLYTNVAGQRVIRVHTLALPVTDNISTIFKGADLDAQVGGKYEIGKVASRRISLCSL